MKKINRAAALKYESNYDAPVVTASGIGYIADKIIDKAKENDVPVVINEELANLLSNVDVGENIPTELYAAVAEIIAYVMKMDNIVDRR